MTTLSIIIVNYNVQYFLEYCLKSILRSKVNFNYEIIVVDNASTDNSLQMIAEQFSHVHTIANKENLGFSKANNQGIRIAQGKYCLLLNPDTILQEDTLQIAVNELENDSTIGAIGVKMLDGSGNFLPESKRGFPSLSAAFSKMTGLAKLFPTSKYFGQYHLSYLDQNHNHEVDVLSGAFMMIRKNILEQVGSLDESYFMYGEDIDLSYQIKKAGYKNKYLATTSIIHFKGESTKKGSLNYIKLFYGAMLIFAKKNLPKQHSFFLTPIIHLGIFVQAFLSVLKQIANRILLPILDFACIFGVLVSLMYIFENYIKVDEKLNYPTSFLYFNIPLYTAIFMSNLYVFKVYQKQCTWKHIFIALSFGFAFISIVYSFFPLSLRSSRAIILGSYLINVPLLIFYRLILNIFVVITPHLTQSKCKYAIVCQPEEIEHIKNAMNKSFKRAHFLGYISNFPSDEKYFIGTTHQLIDIIKAYEISDLVFSTHSLEMKKIIEIMSISAQYNLHYRMYNNTQNIISSKNKNTQGEILLLNIDHNQSNNIIDKILNWIQ